MRLIDVDELLKKMEILDWQETYLPIHFKEMVIDETPTAEPVYFPPCVDCQDRSKEILTAYNNMKKMQAYTKEEVITMLEKIKAEIKEKEKEYLHDFFIDLDAQDKTEHEKIIDIIDQKIEKVKG